MSEDTSTAGVCCIIPVRGGSKGIPRKNLAIVGGLSLLERTILQAAEVYSAADIFVSTEDQELAETASRSGARVIDRPVELAEDESTTNSVVSHLLGAVDPSRARYRSFTILQVTSPFRSASDISAAERLMRSGAYDSVLSAYREAHAHPAKMYWWEGGKATPVAPAHERARRQELPPVYRRNGAIFACTRDYFEATGLLWGGTIGLVVMPRSRSLDIDTTDDLEEARRLIDSPHE